MAAIDALHLEPKAKDTLTFLLKVEVAIGTNPSLPSMRTARLTNC